MRIATLQFAPHLGDVQGNIRRAEELLKLGNSSTNNCGQGDKVKSVSGTGIEALQPELLVLPELAFTGYNFPSLEAITPYLELMGEGPTSKWAISMAKRLDCKVCVGYPEIQKASSPQQQNFSRDAPSTNKCFNSLLVVDCDGRILLNYRKRFLYYTDETWASEGDAGWGFHTLLFPPSENLMKDAGPTTIHRTLDSDVRHVPTSFGICMDINPYRFEAPPTAWEFANRVIDSESQLVVLSMAWLTAQEQEDFDSLGNQPDLDTFNYWMRRLWPLIEKRMMHDSGFENWPARLERKIVVVFANRTGEEKATEGNKTARYAGTSTIIAITQRLHEPGSSSTTARGNMDFSWDDGHDLEDFDVKILCWSMKGAMETGICFADTLSKPDIIFEPVHKLDDP